MATGFEAAGLALGIFPVVIEGIKFSISSAEKVKEMMHHKRTLDGFIRELEMEKSIFDNTWCILMTRAGILIEPSMEIPSETIEEVVSCLPPTSVKSFLDACQQLCTILERLGERFQKYEQNTVGYRKMYTMLKHFDRKDREQRLERIHKLNYILHNLVFGAPQTAVNKLRKGVAGGYQQVRKRAIILYDALKEKLQSSTCHCTIPHSANLQLDVTHNPKMRRLSLLFPVPAEQAKAEKYLILRELEFENMKNLDPFESVSDKKTTECPKIRMGGLFSESSGPSLRCMPDQDPITPQSAAAYTAGQQMTEPKQTLLSSAWGQVSNLLPRPKSPLKTNQKKVAFCLPARETRPSPIESSPPPIVSDRIIKCFCSTIQRITGVHICVGILVSNDSKHQVWVPRVPLAMPTSTRVVPLAELLFLPKPSIGERLKLAVRLASSVLQLHNTEWLQERWSKEDIYLIQGDSSRSRNPSLETPVVHQAFTPKPCISEVPLVSCIIRCNPSLFSLGIVLIELWFWRSVESFQADESQASCGPLVNPGTARIVTVARLIEELYRDAGTNYGSSVHHCIYGIPHQETQLEKDAFKIAVIPRVLEPLEKDLEHCSGKSLEEIFKRED